MTNNNYIPGDVPQHAKETYQHNWNIFTKGTGRVLMFAGDQKIEHLNSDFYDQDENDLISDADASPEHLFHIAANSPVSGLAVQIGLASQYGNDFPLVPLIIKLNSKSPLVDVEQKDPLSLAFTDIDDILKLKANGINVVGIGYTIYLGSEFEGVMLKEAAQAINNAHRHGLLAILWIYPRGKAVQNEKSIEIISGAAGVAATLGADFVKVNSPEGEIDDAATALRQATLAAGKTGVIISGGSNTSAANYIYRTILQLKLGKTAGIAVGRNVHQRSFEDAVNLCKALGVVIFDNADEDTAIGIATGRITCKTIKS
jgi:fructose-bisphosphate aldolase / 6-deoxy-5-ketofructose 1-phosphate synthase